MGDYFFIASAIFSVVNGTVILCLNPRRTVNKVFFGSSIWIALWSASVVFAIRSGRNHEGTSNATLLFWLRSSSAIAAFSLWLIWLMKAALLFEGVAARVILRRSWLWFSISVLLAILAFSESFIPSTSTPANKGRGVGYDAYVFAITICCISMLVDAIRKAKGFSGIRRMEMQYLVVGALCACTIVVACHALGIAFNVTWLRHSSSIWFAMLQGVTVWAVCYHRIFDAQEIMLSAGQRIALHSTLGFAAIGVYGILCHFLHTQWALYWSAVTVSLASLLLDNPIRRWLRLDLEHKLSEPRRMVIEWARTEPDESALQTRFVGLLHTTSRADVKIFLSLTEGKFSCAQLELAPDWSGFAVLCRDGWTTPERLERSRTAVGSNECSDLMKRFNLGALLAVPRGSQTPSLLVGFGRMNSLRPYTFPTLPLLLELAELMDNILTHARAAAHATRLKKMMSAAILSRGLAHDLQNLATPFVAYLLCTESRVTPGTAESEALAAAKHSLRVMQEYIRESLFFSRTLLPDYTQIDIHHLFLSVTRLCHEQASKARVTVTIKSLGPSSFNADRALIQRLLQNLVLNGIEASDPGGQIELDAQVVDSKLLTLSVKDTGSGIDAKVLPNIFDPYFTTKGNRADGTRIGLGLAICAKIAAVHDGSIVALPNLPQGTIFRVSLPRDPTEPNSRVPISDGGPSILHP
jgi:signal transduction histidine kinase